MKFHLTMLASTFLLTSLASAADAQLLPRLFGPKTPDKTAKAATPDARRVTEAAVEIAWLADPITFPYYLEARATNAQLEVRGYVPNKAVREQALRIAQLHASMPVTDALKEHPSLLVRASQMSPAQLQSSVQSSLKVALPKQYQKLKAECGNDGSVSVVGPVASLEEKIAVSHSLRRLHGCTSVQNLTTLPGELAHAAPRDRTPVITTSHVKPVVALEPRTKPWWSLGKPQPTPEEPPLLEPRKADLMGPIIIDAKRPAQLDRPILLPDAPEPKKAAVTVEVPTPEPQQAVGKIEAPSPAPKKAAPPNAADLQKRIRSSCPQVRSVEVEMPAAGELRVILEVANENDLQRIADQIFALPDLQNLRAELQFKINAP